MLSLASEKATIPFGHINIDIIAFDQPVRDLNDLDQCFHRYHSGDIGYIWIDTGYETACPCLIFDVRQKYGNYISLNPFSDDCNLDPKNICFSSFFEEVVLSVFSQANNNEFDSATILISKSNPRHMGTIVGAEVISANLRHMKRKWEKPLKGGL